MQRLLATTVIRHTEPGETSGYIYEIDVDRNNVLGKCPIIEPPMTHADPNPRGGMRGAKGIAIAGDTIFIANHSSVFHFDNKWTLLRELTHPSCAGIHDIMHKDETVWITSSRNDLLIQLDYEGKLLHYKNMRDHQEIVNSLGWREPNRLSEEDIQQGTIDFRDPRSHQYEKYDGAHVNSVCCLCNGDMLVMMGLVWTRKQTALLTAKQYLKRFGLWQPLILANKAATAVLSIKKTAMNTDMAVNLAKGRAAIVRFKTDGNIDIPLIVRDANTPMHSLHMRNDGTVLFDNTSTGEIVYFCPESGQLLATIKITDKFLRGLCEVSPTLLAVGAGADICFVDLEKECVLERLSLTANPNETVYDIKLMPTQFASIPQRFEKEMSAVKSDQ